MPKPKNVEKTTRLIIDSGIGNRIVEQGLLVPLDHEDCEYWAQQDERGLCVWAEFCVMGSRTTTVYGVTDKAFGSGPPLDQKQMRLVRRLAGMK